MSAQKVEYSCDKCGAVLGDDEDSNQHFEHGGIKVSISVYPGHYGQYEDICKECADKAVLAAAEGIVGIAHQALLVEDRLNPAAYLWNTMDEAWDTASFGKNSLEYFEGMKSFYNEIRSIIIKRGIKPPTDSKSYF